MSDLEGMYLDAANGGRRVPRPPADLTSRLTDLLSRRPDLAGIGLSYLVEAVTA